MRVLILALALAGCVTPVKAPPIDAHASHLAGHDAPTMEQVAAQTSLRREAMKSAEIAYGAALVASTLALESKTLDRQSHTSIPSAEGNATGAIEMLRAQANADEPMFVAALFYVNFSNNELLKLAEGKRDD